RTVGAHDGVRHDVGNPSNFARINDLYHGDREAMCRQMRGHAYTDEDIAASMKDVYTRDGYVMDPHGATAYRALRDDLATGEKGFFLATAHPSKFPKTVEKVTGVTYKNQVVKAITDVTSHHDVPRITPSLPALKKILLKTT
ncbi:MAG: hypothetical protein K2K65_11145, partial [Duncaniella sp.]|nr:hypothetical protein [Duncaniella sp.]